MATQNINNGEPEKYLPLWWHLFLSVMLVGGIVLAIVNPKLADWTSAVTTKVRSDEWFRFFGILLAAIPITHWIILFSMKWIEKAFELRPGSRRADLWPVAILGSLEGLIYPVAFLIEETGFIGVWLAIKVAGQWAPNFRPRPKGVEDELVAHRRFDRFLIGNALRLILGVATFGVLKIFVLEPA